MEIAAAVYQLIALVLPLLFLGGGIYLAVFFVRSSRERNKRLRAIEEKLDRLTDNRPD
ncbi:hypothetical protein [Alkalicoccus saliphilus]|uniref:hypothetical protein n=1 Tax=Alkalicoccus saliphilus TaxID=200989 RepID=UPI00135766C1|nr:hypothetical protein [Alkalicoccus saliphilus]